MRVERILIRKSDENYKAIKSACGKVPALYNVANYIMRHSFFDNSLKKYSDIDKKLKQEQHECYRALLSSSPNYGDVGEKMFSGKRKKRGLWPWLYKLIVKFKLIN